MFVFRVSAKENTPYGTSLLRMTGGSKQDELGIGFNIVEGNVNGTFEILGYVVCCRPIYFSSVSYV